MHKHTHIHTTDLLYCEYSPCMSCPLKKKITNHISETSNHFTIDTFPSRFPLSVTLNHLLVSAIDCRDTTPGCFTETRNLAEEEEVVREGVCVVHAHTKLSLSSISINMTILESEIASSGACTQVYLSSITKHFL